MIEVPVSSDERKVVLWKQNVSYYILPRVNFSTSRIRELVRGYLIFFVLKGYL